MLSEAIKNNILTKKLTKAMSKLALADVKDKPLSSIFSTPRLSYQTKETPIVIHGPSIVQRGSMAVFEIVGFNPEQRYIVSSTAGKTILINNIITFTAPIEGNRAIISVNGHDHQVFITDEPVIASIAKISKPVVTVTSIGCKASFNSSAFKAEGVDDDHCNTDWQIATDESFKSIIGSAMNSMMCKTHWSISNLPINITIYVRVRHRGNKLGESDWSDSISFITKPVYIHPSEEAELIPSDPSERALLGVSTAMSSDGKIVAIGAHGSTINDNPEAGKVYIFTKELSSWIQTAVIIPEDGSSNDWFGHSVSLDSTGTTLVIGAYGADVGSQQMAGKVYIYTRTELGWIPGAILTSSEATSNDAFGFSTAISSSGNTIVIGAYMFGSDIPVGRAYVFTKTSSGWIEEAILGNPDKGINDQFGWSVAIDGSENRVYITAPCADYDGALAIGKVHIYYRSNIEMRYGNKGTCGTTWQYDATLIASDHASKDHFGWSIAVNKNSTILAVSAPFARSGRKSRVGKVYIYTRNALSWTESLVIHSSDEVTNGKFGIALAMNTYGDKLVISASHADNPGAPESGKVYIFTNSDYEWSQKTILTAEDKEPVDLFGSSISMDAFGKRIVITSPLVAIKGFPNSGKAYVYS